MLFWSFVLAFVLGILYYTMYPRTDFIAVSEKPQAETAVVAFINAHQAAKDLMYSVDHTSCEKTTEIVEENGEEQITVKYDCPTPSVTMTYKTHMKNVPTTLAESVSGVLKGQKTAEAEPTKGLGYIDEKWRNALAYKGNAILKEHQNAIYSAVACVKTIYKKNPDGTDSDEIEKYELVFECDGTTDYVLSFMDPYAATWIDNDKIARRELWRSALLRRARGSYECGVLYPKIYSKTIATGTDTQVQVETIHLIDDSKYDATADYVLDNSVRFTVSVPKVITDELVSAGYGRTYIDDGGLSHSEMSDMLFCITPISDIKTTLKRRYQYNVTE